MKNISLKQRLIIPIALLGIVALLSNILSILNIRNVNMSASNIADNYMEGKDMLSDICQSSMNIHKMALSHIVATDYDTMTTLVRQIKEQEAVLDGKLAEFERYVLPEDAAQYEMLLSDYDSFQHALVFLVCASASHKTQDAYAFANGDVALYAQAMETDIDALNAFISAQTQDARNHLSTVYLLSLVAGAAAALICVLLVFADLKLITKYVVIPVKSILKTIKESAGRINLMTARCSKGRGLRKEVRLTCLLLRDSYPKRFRRWQAMCPRLMTMRKLSGWMRRIWQRSAAPYRSTAPI